MLPLDHVQHLIRRLRRIAHLHQRNVAAADGPAALDLRTSSRSGWNGWPSMPNITPCGACPAER